MTMEFDRVQQTQTPAAPARRHKRWRAGTIGLAALALAGGVWGWRHQRAAPPSAEAAEASVLELAPSDAATIEARALDLKLALSGSLTPLTQASVKSKSSPKSPAWSAISRRAGARCGRPGCTSASAARPSKWQKP